MRSRACTWHGAARSTRSAIDWRRCRDALVAARFRLIFRRYAGKDACGGGGGAYVPGGCDHRDGPGHSGVHGRDQGLPRVWNIGDEWVSHYSSLCKLRDVRTWKHLCAAAIWGVYERMFAPTLDRIWVVSDEEQRHMRRWAGERTSTCCQNGVDADYFAPTGVESGRTPPFSGDGSTSRPICRRCSGSAGRSGRRCGAHSRTRSFRSSASILAKKRIASRACRGGAHTGPGGPAREVGEQAVVVMPFHSGGGIKNKLLEAAAMGKAVVCTSLACGGLRGNPPLRVVNTREDWIAAIAELWGDAAARRRARHRGAQLGRPRTLLGPHGQAGRRVVERRHGPPTVVFMNGHLAHRRGCPKHLRCPMNVDSRYAR